MVSTNEKGELMVPGNVVNEEAYHTLLRRIKEVEADPSRFYEAKTAEYVFDFQTSYTNVLRLIEVHKIAEYEAEIVKQKAKEYKSLFGSLNKLRWDAFKGDRSINKNSMLDFRKAELIGLFGRFNTVTEVHKIITTEWHLSVAYSTVDRFRKDNLEAIQAEQDKYVKDWSGLKLVYKKSRLDEYSGLYEDRKTRYEQSHNREDYRLLLQTLEAIRKEIEGDRLTVDGSLEVNVQQTINLHVQQEVLRNINILQFIIARVAVRTGVDQAFLMQRLEKSYYAKFTGFAEPDNNRASDEIYYPSRELYDFNRIKVENARIISEDKIVRELPPVEEETKEVGNALLNALLRRKKMIIESEKKVSEHEGNKEVGQVKSTKRNSIKKLKEKIKQQSKKK